jgi:hypothetical protein
MNVFRDATKNICISLKLEEAKLAGGRFHRRPSRQGGATKYSPILDEETERAAKITRIPTGAGA